MPLENTTRRSAASSDQLVQTDDTTIIPVTQEFITVTKEMVETGKIHIRKTIAEEEATIDLPLIQEGYQIERRAGSKELLIHHPPIRYEGENMIIPVVKEVLVVEKRFEVLEEVHVIKTKTEVPYLQQVSLLKESVDIQRTSDSH